MAIYRTGTASLAANGKATGKGTAWTSALSLIRVGATIVFLSGSKPVFGAVAEIISDTEMNIITTGGATATDGVYVIMLHDGITVEGLAQDVAETLRYYQSRETSIADILDYLENNPIDETLKQIQQLLKDTQASEAAAKDSSDLAQKWAANPVGSVVADGKYSSLHYAQKSADSATASAKSATASETSNKASKASATASEASNQASKASADAAKVSETNSKASEDKINQALSGTIKNMGRPAAFTPAISSYDDMGPTDVFAGIWNATAAADYNIPGLPEATAGEFEVSKNGAYSGMQKFTTRYGIIYQRSLTAAWNATTKPWDIWTQVGFVASSTSLADINAAIYAGSYIFTSNGTDCPLANGTIATVEVRPYNSGRITQVVRSAVSNSERDREFKRFGQVSSGVATWGAWSEYALMNLNGITAALRGVGGVFSLGADGANPLHAVSLRQMQAAIANVSSSGGINGVMSTFIGDISWWHGDPAQLPTAYSAPSGQLLLRSDYPEVWSLISAGVFKSVTDAAWNSNVGNRGMFSTGTVTSGANANFRMPDYNGAVSGTPSGVFMRGSQSGMLPGEIRSSALPNIRGSATSDLNGRAWLPYSTMDGAIYSDDAHSTTGTFQPNSGTYVTSGSQDDRLRFDASRFSSVYQEGVTEVRPASVSGTWIMRMKGTFSAQTSFNVMVAAATAPANNSTTEGGAVRSSLVGPDGSELTGVTMKARHTVDASGNVSKRLVLGVTGGSGEVRIAENGTVGIDGSLACGDLSVNGNLTLATAAQRRALLNHLGVTGATNRIVIPISSTQAVQIVSSTTVGNQNSSGDSTVTFPYGFTTINSVILCNGDAAVGALTMGILNSIRTGGFDVRVYNGGSPLSGACRINYIATGLINI